MQFSCGAKSLSPVLASDETAEQTSDASGVVAFSGSKFGTSWSVKANTPQGTTREDIQAAIESQLEEIDAAVSLWRDDSEVQRFTKPENVGVALPISDILLDMLIVSRQIYFESGGAFDPTVGAVVVERGYGPDASSIEPGIDGKSNFIADVKLDQIAATLTVTRPVLIDLAGVAKGWAADAVAEYLEDLAVEDYLVEIGGELRVKGLRDLGEPWVIGIEYPYQSARVVGMRMYTYDGAALGIATSGNYRNFREREDGVADTHIVDPTTGSPMIIDGFSGVTVVSDSAAIADAWATALVVLGEEGKAVAEELELAVCWYFAEPDDWSCSSAVTERKTVYFEER